MTSMPTDDTWITTAAGRLHARRWSADPTGSGERAPIILFHDSLGCVALWRDFPERLARATGRSVVAYDRLGYGQSDRHPGRLGPRFVQDEARGAFQALRSQLQIRDFIAFGHSIGGGMAVACAAAWPDECLGVVVESAQVFVEQRTLDGISQAKEHFDQPGQLERLEKYHGDKAVWALSAWVDTWFAPWFAIWNLDAELQRIRCPLLAIYGDNDEYGSLRHPERIGRVLTEPMTLQVMHGCGHFPHRERSNEVADVTARWLDATCRSTPVS